MQVYWLPEWHFSQPVFCSSPELLGLRQGNSIHALSFQHKTPRPGAQGRNTENCSASLSLSICLCPDTRSIHKPTDTGNWIMTGSHEIILSFPISTQGNLHSAVPYSHTTRLPMSGFSFLSLVEGNYSKCETGKRITVRSCSLFNNPTQDAIIL